MAAVPQAPWLDQLDDVERWQLERKDHLGDRSPEVLIMGGGIRGVCTAAACQIAGLGSVTLVERERLGAGSTGGAAALLQPEPHHGIDPVPFVEMGRRSLELWRAHDSRVDGGVGLIDVDWFGLDPQPPPFAANLPAAAVRLNERDVHTVIPELARPLGAVRIPRQARLNPLRAVARLAARLSTVMTGVEAVEVTIRDEAVMSVDTTVGTFTPVVAVFATGGPPVGIGLPMDIPADQVKRHLIATAPAPFRLPGRVAPLATQLEDGALICGGTLDIGDGTVARSEVIAAVKAALDADPPATSALPITHGLVLLPAHPPRQLAHHRPRSRHPQRLVHLRSLPHQRAHGTSQRTSTRRVDRQRHTTTRRRLPLSRPPIAQAVDRFTVTRARLRQRVKRLAGRLEATRQYLATARRLEDGRGLDDQVIMGGVILQEPVMR